jgi:hypothetical protein
MPAPGATKWRSTRLTAAATATLWQPSAEATATQLPAPWRAPHPRRQALPGRGLTQSRAGRGRAGWRGRRSRPPRRPRRPPERCPPAPPGNRRWPRQEGATAVGHGDRGQAAPTAARPTKAIPAESPGTPSPSRDLPGRWPSRRDLRNRIVGRSTGKRFSTSYAGLGCRQALSSWLAGQGVGQWMRPAQQE